MSEFLKKTGNNVVHDKWFWLFSLFTIILLLIGFFTPPYFIIDSSVLIACGEIFAFAVLGTVVKAINDGASAELSKGDTHLKIEKKTECTHNQF